MTDSMGDRMFPSTAPAEPAKVAVPVKAASDAPLENRMYPSTAAADDPVEPPQPVPVGSAEDRLAEFYQPEHYEFDRPAEIAALRAATDRHMYAMPIQTSVMDAIPADDGSKPGFRSAYAREIGEMAADVGFTTDDVDAFAMTARQLASQPQTPETVAARQGDAIDALNSAFGLRAKEAFGAARALLARDPRAAAIAAHSGLGNDPAFIVKLAKLAMASKKKKG